MAGSSSRLLPTHSSVLRRSLGVDHDFERTDRAAVGRGDLGEERGQPFAVGLAPEVEKVAADEIVGMDPEGAFGRRRREAQSSVDVDDHDHVGGVLDQRRVAGLDDARPPGARAAARRRAK